MLIPRTVLNAISHCDPESTSYALGAVQLQRCADGSPVAVATDGRRLIALGWTEDEPNPENQHEQWNGRNVPVDGFETLIPASAIKAQVAKLPKPKASHNLRANHSILMEEPTANGKVTFHGTTGETTSTAVVASEEGRFPKWRDVIPSYAADECVHIAIDPRYLADACKALGDHVCDDESPYIVLTVPMDSAKPLIVSRQWQGKAGAAVIMPCGGDQILSKQAWRPAAYSAPEPVNA